LGWLALALDGSWFGFRLALEVLLMTSLRGVVVGLVFLVGCAVGGAASRFAVPPASAQQAATLTRWEYFCIEEYAARDVTTRANTAGAQGWELVAVGGDNIYVNWCFKRPKG
jgi:hypothetical protein